MGTMLRRGMTAFFLSLSVVIGSLVFVGIPVMADVDSGSGLIYSVSDNKAAITGFVAPASFTGDLIIPGTLGGAPVTSIDSNAFANAGVLISVTIPEGVTSIGSLAFQFCLNINAISIPSSVSTIGEDAFFFCKKLDEMNIAPGNAYYKNDSGILYSKDGARLIRCAVSKTGSFTIPGTVTKIDGGAFCNCISLTAIMIPSTVTQINVGAFADCKGLTSMVLPVNLKSVSNWMFWGASNLNSVIIPNGVTSIGSYAFYSCRNLPGITIPQSVVRIDANAFDICTRLKYVIFKGIVSEIGNSKDSVFSIGTGYVLKIIVPQGSASYYKARLTDTVMDETTAVIAELPQAPTNLKATAISASGIKLTWTESAFADGYSVYRSTSAAGTYNFIATSITSAEYTNTGLTAGTTYYYKVKPYILAGSTKFFGNLSDSAGARAISPAPKNLKTNAVSASSIRLTWSASPGATGYSVYRSSTSTGTYSFVVTSITGTEYIDKGLITGKAYYYKVKPYTLVGGVKMFGAFSLPSGTKAAAPAPLDVEASGLSVNSIRITWSESPGATGYSLYRCPTAGGTYTFIATSITGTEYTNTGLSGGTTYYYKVKAYTLVEGSKIFGVFSTSAAGTTF